MKLKELFQAYEFDEIYPQIGLMFPKGRHLREEFRNAYNLLLDIKPVMSKKQIRYELMEDPDSNEMFLVLMTMISMDHGTFSWARS